MKRTGLRLPCIAISIACLLLLVPGAAAAKKKKKNQTPWYRHTAEFACGVPDPAAVPPAGVVAGEYATTISIHNGAGLDAMLMKHIALTFPPGDQTPGEFSDEIEEMLPAGRALQMSCEDFRFDFTFPEPPPGPPSASPLDSPYLQGFLVIDSNVPLRMSVVSTATGAAGEVSIDREQVPPGAIGQRYPGHKLVICHIPPGNPDNRRTIAVAHSAWPAHESHGDNQGTCE